MHIKQLKYIYDLILAFLMPIKDLISASINMAITFTCQTASMLYNLLCNMFYLIMSFSPKTNYLSEIAMIVGVAVTIAIPLSYEMIARISDRYKSDVVTNRFRNKFAIKYLPLFLIIYLLLIVILMFLEGSEPYQILWVPMAWLLLLLFIVMALWLLKFMHLLMMHADPDYLIDELSKDANDIFS